MRILRQPAAIVATIFALHWDMIFASGNTQMERALYSECPVNGRLVPMGTTCCHDTADVHYRMAASFDSSNAKCDQVNPQELVLMSDTYCRRRQDDSPHPHHSDMECIYDVQNHNPDCAEQHRQICEAHGGYLYSSDLVLECEDYNPTIRIENSLTCLGVSCDDHDVREYLWAAAADTTMYDGLGACTVTHIQDQTLDDFYKEDVKEMTFIVGIFIGSVLICGVFVKLWSARRKQKSISFLPPTDDDDVSLLPPTEVDDTEQPHSPLSEGETSALYEEEERRSSKDALDGDLGGLNPEEVPIQVEVDVRAMEGELA